MKGIRVEVDMEQETACGISRKDVQRAVFETLLLSEVPLEGKNIHLGIATIVSEEIRKLNRVYRKKDVPTDVLSFPEYEDMNAIIAETAKDITIGDVVVSCEVVRRQAEEDGVSIRREYMYLVSHGVLHLLGFEHGDKMFGIQDEVCDIMCE